MSMFRPRSSQIRRTSRGVPENCSRSFSKISTPSKCAAAAACSFSFNMPESETVAIERRMAGDLVSWVTERRRAQPAFVAFAALIRLTAARRPIR